MPLGVWNNQWVLRCINHEMHSSGQPSTMEMAPGWNVVAGTSTPVIMFAGQPPLSLPDPKGAKPVKIYVCNRCGYTEMYSAPFIDPTWKAVK